jgi:hypothetical protein
MDARIEAFLKDVRELEGNTGTDVREGVSRHLATYESDFPYIAPASYRECVVEEIERQKGTPAAVHLGIVLQAIDSGALAGTPAGRDHAPHIG